MEILKIIEVSSRDSDKQSKQIKQEINNYWQLRTANNEAKQFAENFYFLEDENMSRLVITKKQACCNSNLIYIYKILKENNAQELHYYFYKN